MVLGVYLSIKPYRFMSTLSAQTANCTVCTVTTHAVGFAYFIFRALV